MSAAVAEADFAAPGGADEMALYVSRYVAIGLIAGAVIALQLVIMRIYAAGSWAHFGSLVVGLAMLGFGLASAIMTLRQSWFDANWDRLSRIALVAIGPAIVLVNLIAQQFPFNAIFLISDPVQKWLLLANYILYFVPFLIAAFFLGIVFSKARLRFGRAYCADLVGAGIGGLLTLPAMNLLFPEDLILLPLAMWLAGALCWIGSWRSKQALILIGVAVLSTAVHFGASPVLGLNRLAVSDYKGVSYVRKFPDKRRIYNRATPFGHIEIYSSSYLHFAPGLSDNASINLSRLPANAYLGLYVDGEGPTGIIKELPANQTGYFDYLPMTYPYLIKKDPSVFVVQLNGGISTWVALRKGASEVTAAEANPAVLTALSEDRQLRRFTGDLLHRDRVKVIDGEGRAYLAYTDNRYDIVDFSLADSTGLSSPGGFAVVEKYAYTVEAMRSYMRALKPGGILSVTIWNKEEPPKSVPKLYGTVTAAALADAGSKKALASSMYAVSSYLNTTTVLYKKGGFTPAEIALLRENTSDLSFDEVYYPGMPYDPSRKDKVFADFEATIYSGGTDTQVSEDIGPDPMDALTEGKEETEPVPYVQPATELGRIIMAEAVRGGWSALASKYVFDPTPLTNARPYFSGYVRPTDLPRILDRLELMQDDWGYLLVWGTLIVAIICAVPLVLIPIVGGWRALFSAMPGKFGTIVFFSCLGLGYIMVEVGLIAYFVLALTNPTVSVAVLITTMLIFSGLGSLASERILPSHKKALPAIMLAIATILLVYALILADFLSAIGGLPYALRMACCVALLAPPAFLMGFPMAIAMSSLDLGGKHSMFIWAWGVNGCFSVVGSALVPLVSVSFGIPSVLMVAALAYFIAIPACLAVMKPLKSSDGEAALA